MLQAYGEIQFAPQWLPLRVVPGVHLRPTVSPEHRGLRLVGREYDETDERWGRERRFLMSGERLPGLPDLKGVFPAPAAGGVPEGLRLVTFEHGGWTRLADYLGRAALRARAEGRPPEALPLLPPLLVAWAFWPLVRALVSFHGRGLCYRAVSAETVEADVEGFRFVVAAPIGPPSTASDSEYGVTRVTGRSTAAMSEVPAPEVAAGEVTEAGDIFSVGALMLRALTGRSPVEVRQGAPVFSRDRVEEVFREFRTSAGTLPGGSALADLVHRMLAFRPDGRPTAAEVARVLTDVLYDEGSAAGGTVALRLVQEFLVTGEFDPDWVGRQQEAWAALFRKRPAPRGTPVVRPVQARVVLPFRSLSERLRAAVTVLRTGEVEGWVEVSVETEQAGPIRE